MMAELAASRAVLDPRLLEILACPRCHSDLHSEDEYLMCDTGHKYPVVEGIPVFILPEKQQTIGIASASYCAAERRTGSPLYTDTLGLSDVEKAGIETQWHQRRGVCRIDPAISYLVGATSGLAYAELIGRLPEYPIPRIPVGRGSGELLLDVGCNWGRWSASASRNGWRAVALDPSLGALVAARRAFGNDGTLSFVCGDARFLPFKTGAFRCVFSYSVLQHFSEADAENALAEIGRVLRPNGWSHVQMAHRGGLRSTWVRTRRTYAEGGVFRVRYWPLAQLKRAFSMRIGPTVLIPEAFGGLGLLFEDWRCVSGKAKLLIFLSAAMKAASRFVRPLLLLADSVYVVSVKR